MMRIEIISVSRKQPDWVRSGFETYAKRLRGACSLSLTELAPERAGKSVPAERRVEREGARILSAVPKGARIVALDERGRQFSTAGLRDRLADWLTRGAAVAMPIGGPDGLAAECLERADERWSISPLTLPHGLVRIVVAEALYRAFSLLGNHPYHRE